MRLCKSVYTPEWVYRRVRSECGLPNRWLPNCSQAATQVAQVRLLDAYHAIMHICDRPEAEQKLLMVGLPRLT